MSDQAAEWRTADAVFDRLLDMPREQWQALVDEQSAPVRALLLRLIAAHETAGPLDRSMDAGVASSHVPERIGDWQRGEEIGRGGMAVVYRAERLLGDVRQVAALKLLTVAALAADGRRHLQREHQMLARLQHPGIVPLLDAGVLDDGTPYLAMPLVEGQRIDDWCVSRALTAAEIVQLFAQVCDAVSYAHRRLVIHRDLKPGNILVDGDGHVHLLDFGIARLLDSGTDQEATATQLRALTPQYAAPEQFRGEDSGTAVDVFGLGAVLYQLMTGRPPRLSAADKADTLTLPSRAAASNHALDPTRRASLGRDLHGDLDAILLNALDEDPAQRYPDAAALHADLSRWLQHRPVQARRAGSLYRLGKFAARHRGAVAVASLLLLAIGAGLVGTMWQAKRAEQQAVIAQQEAQRATALNRFLADLFLSTNPSGNGGVPTLLDVLDRGSEQAREARDAGDSQLAADVLGLTGIARLQISDYTQSIADLRDSLALFREQQPLPTRKIASHLREISVAQRSSGALEDAIANAEQSVAMYDAMPGSATESDRLLARLALVNALRDDGQNDRAEPMLRDLLDDYANSDQRNTHGHLDTLNALSTLLALSGRTGEEQVPLQEQRIAIVRALYGEDSGWYAYTLADAVPTFKFIGDIDRAESLATEALAISGHVYDKPHLIPAVAHCNYGALLMQLGRLQPALEQLDTAIAIDQQLGRSDLHAESCRFDRAIVHFELGDYPAALSDIADQQRLAEKRGDGFSRYTLPDCGIEVSVKIRMEQLDLARQRYAECEAIAADESVETLPDYLVAAAVELALLRGDMATADALIADLIERLPASTADTKWLRSRQLALISARLQGNAAEVERLQTQLRPQLAELAAVAGDRSQSAAHTHACLDEAAAPSIPDSACWQIP